MLCSSAGRGCWKAFLTFVPKTEVFDFAGELQSVCWLSKMAKHYRSQFSSWRAKGQFYKGHLSIASMTLPFPFASWGLSQRSPTYSQEKCDEQDAETPKGGMKWLHASKWCCPCVFIKRISRGVLRCAWWAKTCIKSAIQTHITPSRSTNAHRSGMPLDLGPW